MTTIGFTGTRNGMSDPQRESVEILLRRLFAEGFTVARHGMCVGADADFHRIARTIGYFLIGHPGVNGQGVCHTRASVHCDVQMSPKPFLERDYDIVNESQVMIATPKGAPERRSGTWTTVRFARTIGRQLYLVEPDGTVRE